MNTDVVCLHIWQRELPALILVNKLPIIGSRFRLIARYLAIPLEPIK